MSKPVSYDNKFYDKSRQYFERGLGVWRSFVLEDLRATSIADFGCGQGDWLEPLQGDIPVWGCDGFADEAHLRIDRSNFRKLQLGDAWPQEIDAGRRDVVMSLEAMEHVTADKERAFLDCMLSPEPRLVVFGVASGWGTYDPTQHKLNRLGEREPGGPGWHKQWGRHHVNCQPVEAVVAKMLDRGYVVDEALSAKFSNLRVTGKTKKGKMAFASFYRKNTRVYRAVA